MRKLDGLDKQSPKQTSVATKSITRTCLKLLRTPVIFIDWREHQKALKGGLLEMPEFAMYWRLHR